MKHVPHYTKILTIGSRYTENALVGEVIIQEKVDGSQFRFGVNEDKELVIASKSIQIHPEAVQKLFKPAVDHVLAMKRRILSFAPDTYFYAETLCKPKHNVLKYNNVPLNHIVLFDVLENGKWASRERLESIAAVLKIDIIPELYRGTIERKRIDTGAGGYKSSAIDFLKRIIETTPSYLGNEKVEGVVIKNYKQTILLGGQVFPLFTKRVREAFKERHDIEWKTRKPKASVQDYINGFQSDARWQKAVIHLREKGLLTQSPKDIGLLIKTVQQDIVEEEKENIMNYLYKHFSKDILRISVKGLPEWYKEKLLENLK